MMNTSRLFRLIRQEKIFVSDYSAITITKHININREGFAQSVLCRSC